jgi:hypothetical protein
MREKLSVIKAAAEALREKTMAVDGDVMMEDA